MRTNPKSVSICDRLFLNLIHLCVGYVISCPKMVYTVLCSEKIATDNKMYGVRIKCRPQIVAIEEHFNTQNPKIMEFISLKNCGQFLVHSLGAFRKTLCWAKAYLHATVANATATTDADVNIAIAVLMLP